MMGSTYADSAANASPSTVVARPWDRRAGRHILELHRRAANGSAALLGWLASQSGYWVGLLERSTGNVLVDTSPGIGSDVMWSLMRGLEQMVARGLPTFEVSDDAGSRVVLFAVDHPAGADGPIVALVGRADLPLPLTGDEAVVVSNCWLAEEARRLEAHLVETESRCREAVLDLLKSRQVATARRVASAALTPELPDPVRVHIIECPPELCSAVTHRCAELTGGRVWMVQEPIRTESRLGPRPAAEWASTSVVALAPPSAGTDQGVLPLEASLAADVDGCVVGASHVVALDDLPVGYAQALEALAHARGRPQRWARFDDAGDLPTQIGELGYAWANLLLAPLLSYEPPRATYPDANEMIATARAWLSVSTAATHHLHLGKNTLRRRVRLIEDILGLDLARTGHQAALDLALRINAREPAARPNPAAVLDLEDLLRLPNSQWWARATLRPLWEADEERRRSSNTFVLEDTLRVWLDSRSRNSLWNSDACLSEAAEQLRLSPFSVRKRILRIGHVLERPVLHSLRARYDLWLATTANDLASCDADGSERWSGGPAMQVGASPQGPNLAATVRSDLKTLGLSRGYRNRGNPRIVVATPADRAG